MNIDTDKIMGNLYRVWIDDLMMSISIGVNADEIEDIRVKVGHYYF